MRKIMAIAVVVGLIACTSRATPSVMELLMPIPGGFGISKIEHKSVLIGGQQAPAAERPALDALDGRGILSTAYFKYWLDNGAAYKVRINLYRNPALLQQDWQRRYPPDSLAQAQPLPAGLQGFIQGKRIASFRIETALVEVAAGKDVERLGDFVLEYAGFVRSQFR